MRAFINIFTFATLLYLSVKAELYFLIQMIFITIVWHFIIGMIFKFIEGQAHEEWFLRAKTYKYLKIKEIAYCLLYPAFIYGSLIVFISTVTSMRSGSGISHDDLGLVILLFSLNGTLHPKFWLKKEIDFQSLNQYYILNGFMVFIVVVEFLNIKFLNKTLFVVILPIGATILYSYKNRKQIISQDSKAKA